MFFRYNSEIKNIRKEKSSLPVNLHIGYCGGRISVSALTRGSLTVEAACVMPIFLFSVITILYFMQMIGVAVKLTGGIQDTGKELAIYVFAEKVSGIDQENAGMQMIIGSLSAAYAKSKILERAQINDDGLNMDTSSFLKNSEMIDLVGYYKIKNPSSILPLPQVNLLVRGRVRAWTGRQAISKETRDDKANEEMVLVTTNGNVYHKDPNCTHLKLSIQSVPLNQILVYRNEGGGKYYACERCGGARTSLVYITDSGDRYHSSLSCSGLKRGVLTVPISQVENLSPCSRCGR